MSTMLENLNSKAIQLGIPLGVHLDVTWRCNERCVHCYLDHDDLGEMTYDEIEDLLTQMAAAGVFFLTISGGEPLLRKDLFAIIRRARELTFNVKLKTNAILIREKEAALIRELGVETVQVSIYSHRPEVHDAITKVKGSLERSLAAIRFMVSQGLKVTMANVVMKQTRFDYPGVQELAAELGAMFTIDPTITPHINGDRSTARDSTSRAQDLREIMNDKTIAGATRTSSRGHSRRRRRRPGQDAMQRGTQRLLRIALRRRLSMRAIPSAQRQRPPAEVHRHLEIFAAARGGPLDPLARPAGLLDLLACRRLHALPGPRIHGRQHARSVDGGLREIVRQNRYSQRQYAAEGGCVERAIRLIGRLA